MAKVNITKPTGSVDSLAILSAFRENNNTYIIFDSEKMGSMGLPIIYVSKLVNDKLSKIDEDSEWEVVKGYLKGIINGTNFNYIKVSDNFNADEAFYRPLTLPQASFDVIKNKYVVKDDTSASAPILEPTTIASNDNSPVVPTPFETETPMVNSSVTVTPSVVEVSPAAMSPANGATPQVQVAPTPAPVTSSTSDFIPNLNMSETIEQPQMTNSTTVEPVIPSSNVQSNVGEMTVASAPVNTVVMPQVTPTSEVASVPQAINPVSINSEIPTSRFDGDKETFMKACENMFDALLSKYQKELANIEAREQELAKKEAEIELKLKNANEHLANAQARETVANIAHDNAQRVMDLNNLMPSNPTINNQTTNPTGVI